MRRYRYTVSGIDGNENPWQVSGWANAEVGEFLTQLPQVIGAEVFMQLTGGLAVYGEPGLRCKGPYRYLKCVIEEEVNDYNDDN